MYFFFLCCQEALLLFQKSVIIFMKYIKSILHNRLFNFEDTFQNPQFIFFFFLSKKKKKRKGDQHSNIFSFQPCTCYRMCSLYTFFFSFVHAPECAYCTHILYICHVIRFFLYFTLAKDGVKCNCIYAHRFVPVIVFHKKNPVCKYG